MELYPLKFRPILMERLWGGNKLVDLLGKTPAGDGIGESWEISGVEGHVSEAVNGELAGKTLNDLITMFGPNLLGQEVMARFKGEFPILIKFIDAKKDLSIQLHPNDELAKQRHNSLGKTEMWYIMDSDEDAQLIIGFNENIDLNTYRSKLENDALEDILQYEYVQSGDTFFIHPGKIHAIGAGVLLAEIQQTSDITYRIFDFNRKDKDGNLRELHTDLALEAIDFDARDDFKVVYEKRKNVVNPMVDTPHFKTNFIHLTDDQQMYLNERDSFTIYMCVDGSMQIEANQTILELSKGETVLIPAELTSLQIRTKGVKILDVSI